MVNLLPAVLIGGPPNSGKSVLFYSLTKALYERGIKHHIIRACPDGEGNWFQEIHRNLDPETVRLIRVKAKAKWSTAFVEGICRDLEHRHLPMLVDMGGRPQAWQHCILQQCTHSILLLRNDDTERATFWQQLVITNGLLPLAQIHTSTESISSLTEASPIVRGSFVGLERGTLAIGPLFDALVEQIAALFSTYSLAELERATLMNAPELPVHVGQLLQTLEPYAEKWRPALLRTLAEELPVNTALAIYGKGPNWLYGALAAQVGNQPFYQFDPRIGWITSPTLVLSSETTSEDVAVKVRDVQDAQLLSVHILYDHLDYLQADQLPMRQVSLARGLIIEGKIPLWLVTALVRLYNNAGVPWIACYQPQENGAVVVCSHRGAYAVGDIIPMQLPLH